MHDIVNRIIDSKRAGDTRPTVAIAADLRKREAKDDLIAELAARDAHLANDELRRQIREEHLQQQGTLELGQMIPALIETKTGDPKLRDLATVSEVTWHMAQQSKFHARRHGIADRIEARWLQTVQEREFSDGDVIGALRWGDKVCVICKRALFDPDDPGVDWAHDRPVAAMSGDDSAGWAHQHCNREEGAR